jgi:DNA-binding CsgD family transcriptional regulator/predicted negative regulator of RcsB-dependent stress response
MGLRRLVNERGFVLRLEGLSPRELGDLARRRTSVQLPQRAREALRDHTGGNPLYARTLLDELPPEVLCRCSGSLPVPRSFEQVLLSRLGRCSLEARRIAEAASVLGLRSDVGLASRMAGLDDPAPALDELVHADLVEVQETSAALITDFVHAMGRAAVYANLSRARRCALHAAAAELLDGPVSLDHLAIAALVPNAGLAGELASQASEDRSHGDAVSAARRLLSAARLAVDRSLRETYLLDAAELLLSSGEVTEVVGLLDDLASGSHTARRGYVLGHLALLRGHQQSAEDLLKGASEHADPVDEAQLMTVTAQRLAELYALQVRPAEAIDWARRALDGGSGSEQGSSALTILVCYLALVGRPGEALPLVDAVLQRESCPARKLGAILARGIVRTWMADFHGAREDLSTVLAARQKALGSRTALLSLAFLAQAEFAMGEWADGTAHADLAVSVATDGGQAWLLAVVHAIASWVPAVQGRWHDAAGHVEAAKEAAGELGDAASIGYAYDAEARLSAFRQDHERVVSLCETLTTLPGQAVIAEPGVLAWRELYVDSLINLGRLEEAKAVLGNLEEHLVVRPQRRLAWVNAARLRGNLEAAQGADEAARAAFEVGLQRVQGLPVSFHRALLEDDYGRFLRRTGQRRHAAEQLCSARDAFAVLGAGPFRERSERELAVCGLTPRRRRSVARRTELTPQELAVAKLVAEGLTNREVSGELFVSPKTVEYHLARIFGKLGVTSRRQIRRAINPEQPQEAKN